MAETNKSKNRRRRNLSLGTAYLTKVAVLAAFAYVLHTYGRFPIFAVFPFSVLDMDFAFVPSLIGGFALGPSAPIIIETVKVLIKMITTGSNTFYIGDLSNYIVSLAFVLPAGLYYSRHKTFKGAVISLFVATVSLIVTSSFSNYFIVVPLYSRFAAGVMEVRGLFSFGYGIAFNLIKATCNSVIVVLIYKRLSPILHLDGQKLKELRVYGVTETTNADGTSALGARLAKRLKGGERIILEGDLGAGKTTFTKGLALGLGVKDLVVSPTFVIAKSYQGTSLALNHLDMYRIEDEEEMLGIGVYEMLEDEKSVTVIEWNRLRNLTGRIIKVNLQYNGDNGRKITISKTDVPDTLQRFDTVKER